MPDLLVTTQTSTHPPITLPLPPCHTGDNAKSLTGGISRHVSCLPYILRSSHVWPVPTKLDLINFRLLGFVAPSRNSLHSESYSADFPCAQEATKNASEVTSHPRGIPKYFHLYFGRVLRSRFDVLLCMLVSREKPFWATICFHSTPVGRLPLHYGV